MKKIIIALVLVISSLATKSYACSCEEWDNANEMLKNADAVMLAMPSEDSNSIGSSDFGPLMKTGMKIIRKYKGKYKKFFYLFVESDNSAACGTSFKKNDGMYLIFAYQKDGKYYSDICNLSVVSPELPGVMKIISDLTK